MSKIISEHLPLVFLILFLPQTWYYQSENVYILSYNHLQFNHTFFFHSQVTKTTETSLHISVGKKKQKESFRLFNWTSAKSGGVFVSGDRWGPLWKAAPLLFGSCVIETSWSRNKSTLFHSYIQLTITVYTHCLRDGKRTFKSKCLCLSNGHPCSRVWSTEGKTGSAFRDIP